MKCIVFIVKVTTPYSDSSTEEIESLVKTMNGCIEEQGIEAKLECLPNIVCAVKDSKFERKFAFSTV